jgi:hypothetical protein
MRFLACTGGNSGGARSFQACRDAGRAHPVTAPVGASGDRSDGGRRRESATGGSGSPQDERRVWALTVTPQLEESIGEQRTPRDERVRRKWRWVERLEREHAVAAARRAESAGRHPLAILPRLRSDRFGLLAKLGLTERAAQRIHLPGVRQRRGRLSTQFDSRCSGTGRPNCVGHDGPSSGGWPEATARRRRCDACPPERTTPGSLPP